MYGELNSGQRNVGRPLLRFKDKLKMNLTSANIAHRDFEQLASCRTKWRTACHQGIRQFSVTEINKLREKREKMKVSSSVPADLSLDLPSCIHCGLVCKSLAGLKCHLRLSKCKHVASLKTYLSCQDLIRRNRRESPSYIYIYIYIYSTHKNNCRTKRSRAKLS